MSILNLVWPLELCFYYCQNFRMPETCCVPNCRGNYKRTRENPAERVSVFKFPTDVELRSKWIKHIPRKDWTVTDKSVVCEKHFASHFIVRIDTAVRADGSILSVPRIHPKLTRDAYPSIFPDTPSYFSTEPPVKRRTPDERRTDLHERDQADFASWVARDNVDNFECLQNKLSEFLKGHSEWIVIPTVGYVSLAIIVVDDSPHVKVCVRISTELVVDVFKGSVQLNSGSLEWICGKEPKLHSWSQFASLLSHYKSTNIITDVNDDVSNIDYLLKDLLERVSDCEEYGCDVERRLQFITEQFSLIFAKQRRYSVDTIKSAFNLMCVSRAAYELVRSTVLILPHMSYLKQLTCVLSGGCDGSEVSHMSYLHSKARALKEHERYVMLLLDEIHVKAGVCYKGGSLSGMATNISAEEATSVQAFMISSLLSSNKDVVALVPVKNLTAAFLKEYMLKVLVMLEKVGFKVFCLISDNNRVNRNMFAELCGGELKTSIPHPVCENRMLFFLFDSVHLLKCIRNNWLGQTDGDKTFLFPDFDSPDELFKASLSHLRLLHEEEKGKIVKTAPSLTYKALYPTNIERQNVNLVLKLFNEKVVTAIGHYGSEKSVDCSGTQIFISLILKLWKILNVKSTSKGIHKRDEAAKPIISMDDDRVKYIISFIHWLNKWESLNQKPRAGRLTNETMFALKHTLCSFIDMFSYLFQHLHVKYILTGKFQTDCLESRFGKYRQMSGSSYNVSVQEIRESEKI